MGNKTLVIYKSKYGSTERYAKWIAKKTGAEIADLATFALSKLADYDTVIFGSSLHAGKIIHIEFITSNWDLLKKKQVVVFVATAAPPDDPGQLKAFEANIPKEIREQIAYFPLRGAYDYHKLDFIDKLLMNGLKVFLILKCFCCKDQRTKEFLNTLYISQDWTNELAIDPIIALVKN